MNLWRCVQWNQDEAILRWEHVKQGPPHMRPPQNARPVRESRPKAGRLHFIWFTQDGPCYATHFRSLLRQDCLKGHIFRTGSSSCFFRFGCRERCGSRARSTNGELTWLGWIQTSWWHVWSSHDRTQILPIYLKSPCFRMSHSE